MTEINKSIKVMIIDVQYTFACFDNMVLKTNYSVQIRAIYSDPDPASYCNSDPDGSVFA